VYSNPDTQPLLPLPSQFAAFMAQEARGCAQFLEVGCGSGRDALFFAQHGYQVAAFDGSQAAITSCREQAARLSLPNAEFFVADVGSEEFLHRTKTILARPGRGNICIYARFFLHAIDDTTESKMFDAIFPYLITGDLVSFEFRTPRDRSLEKATPSHYRRYVDPPSIVARTAKYSLSTIYAVEGFGYAKYKNDDAYVSRLIFLR
jgi:SAM-dependent methyltransferase